MRRSTSALWCLVAVAVGAACTGGAEPALAQPPRPLDGLGAIYPALNDFYIDLHKTPELSLFEEKTSAKMAAQFKRLGYETTEKLGGFGVVGILRNGDGPVVLLRADMDALPVKEQTDSPHASAVTMKNWSGEVVPVMHACGHDVHMTALIGAAELLAKDKDRWRGTLILIAQPAEEGYNGAKLMVDAGLFEKVPKPNFCLGIHVDAQLPAGNIGITVGPASANSNAVDITVYGRGGHGSQPHRTIDPIVIGARIVTSLQTIVSREVDPFDSAVVTVGSFHAGTKRNIIPDEARLALTVRTYKSETRVRVLESIARIAKAEAAAAGAVEPLVDLSGGGYDMVVNDPALCERLSGPLRKSLGAERVQKTEPLMGSEDFGVFGATVGAPSIQFRIGATNAAVFADAKAKGRSLLLPAIHSARFLPDQEPTIRTGVSTFVISALELLGKP
ncbi:MAG: amidohydrolase [Phycisphaerales bacterium]|nr:amidohydrolase [Phycisphaerales bacterium]